MLLLGRECSLCVPALEVVTRSPIIKPNHPLPPPPPIKHPLLQAYLTFTSFLSPPYFKIHLLKQNNTPSNLSWNFLEKDKN